MKHLFYRILSLALLFAPLTTEAKAPTDSVLVYALNGRLVQKYSFNDINNLSFTTTDQKGVVHDSMVMQLIRLNNSTTTPKVPLERVDSIVFRSDGVKIMNPADIPNYDKFYLPSASNEGFEGGAAAMLRSDSKWSWWRSAQSEHFFVFWAPGFGPNPNADTVPSALRVDIDNLLAKAEEFYAMNIDSLHMVETGKGKSYLDRYKMEIYIQYQAEWLATGSGYDNTIGALWINPSTCKPVGHTIAHEIGHSFQYQTYCDNLLKGKANDYKSGFRYGLNGSNGGNGFWEQCAQWQGFQSYKQEAITTYQMDTWMKHHHRHFEHEWQRYASYWLQFLWKDLNGPTALGRVWNESVYPEGAIDAYMRLFCNNDYDSLKAVLFNYAQRAVTFDFNDVRQYVSNQYDRYTTEMLAADNGYYQISFANCPGSTGFNAIPLVVPEQGTQVTVHFRGLAAGSNLAAGDKGNVINADGKTIATTTHYNNIGSGSEGWACGYVGLKADGSRVYGPMHEFTVGADSFSFAAPADLERLWIVVQGAPKNYRQQPWDDDMTDDDQWPYQIKVSGTDMTAYFTVDTTSSLQSIEMAHTLTCDHTLSAYEQGTINLANTGDLAKICKAFGMTSTELAAATKAVSGTGSLTEGKVTFALKQPNGTISYAYSANDGFYVTSTGYKGSWYNGDPIYIQYFPGEFKLVYGHYPGKTAKGSTYSVSPVLVYQKGGKQYTATINLKLKF